MEGAGAADPITGFENQYVFAGARQEGGAGQAIVPGSDNDRVPLPVVHLFAQHELPTVLTDLAGGQFAEFAEFIQ